MNREKMKRNKKETPPINKPLVDIEEQENLIKEKFTEEEVEDMLKDGFTREQIAYVAKEKIEAEKQFSIIERILYLLTWILP